MNKLEAIKERYMQDPLPVRLGGLAANLARVKSFSKNPLNQEVVFNLFEESKYFIEWTAIEAERAVTSELIELQLQIALWQVHWKRNWNDELIRDSIAQKSADWSREILAKSGLLK